MLFEKVQWSLDLCVQVPLPIAFWIVVYSNGIFKNLKILPEQDYYIIALFFPPSLKQVRFAF